MSRQFKHTLSGLVVVGFLCAIWGFLIEPNHITIKEDVIEGDWPALLSDMKIVFLTDPHVGGPHITLDKLKEIVETTNEMNPDLILLGGDYVVTGLVGGTYVPSRKIIDVLSELYAPLGVYGVLGNHDHWDDNERMVKEFASSPIVLLEDDHRVLEYKGAQIAVVGISDYYEAEHNVTRATNGLVEGIPIVAITHTPDIFPELPKHIDLTLAGHTHGGQVSLPLIGPLVVPSKYGTRYAKGLIKEEDKQMYVSAGIGTSIMPVRFLTPPEINVFYLNGGD